MSRCSLVWRRRRTGTVWSLTWSSLPPLNLLLVYDFWRWFLSFWYWLLSAPVITRDDWVRIISYCNSPCLDRLLSLTMGRCSCLTFDSLSKICSTTAFCAHLMTKLKFSSPVITWKHFHLFAFNQTIPVLRKASNLTQKKPVCSDTIACVNHQSEIHLFTAAQKCVFILCLLWIGPEP